MQDVLYIEDIERAAALLKPLRVQVLRLLSEPRSLAELSDLVGQTPQKLHYHVKTLEGAGLVRQVDARRVNARSEAVYQATARSYWLAPQIVGLAGGQQRASDDLSLGFLLSLAEEMQAQLGKLGQTALLEDVPSLGLDLHVHLPDERREAFASEVQDMFQAIARKYGIQDGTQGETFRVILACYPDTPGE